MVGSEIRVGDVVQLKSGGPKMIVAGLGHYDSMENGAKCSWFDTNDQQITAIFAVETLKKVDAEPSDPT